MLFLLNSFRKPLHQIDVVLALDALRSVCRIRRMLCTRGIAVEGAIVSGPVEVSSTT